jgi:DNA polymerase-3 subunit epsilon/ATP-dependent DNA helicase DinG
MTMQCAYVRDGSCFLYRAKKRADAAHLLVVNHALLLSDIAAGGNVLPEYRHLVVDEAHHLEEQATNQFGFSAGEGDLLNWLDQLHMRGGRGAESGLAATAVNATRGVQQILGVSAQVQQVARALSQAVTRARDKVPSFFQRLRTFATEHGNARGDTDDRLSINRGIRVQPDWADIEASWFDVDEDLAKVTGIIEEFAAMLSKAEQTDLLDRDAVLAEANELLDRGEELRRGISRIIGKDDRDTVCWVTMGRQEHSPVLSSAPLSVAETLNRTLFTPRDSVVLTSATLTTDESFGYIKERLGAQDARELSLGSPFDYRTSTLLLMPTDMPEPDQPGYAAAVQSALIEMVQASEGRALVLFTSHAALRTAYNGIKRQLEEQKILVLGQGIDGPPKQLLATLRDSPRVVVLGAASFWEGVDVTGEALSLLVLARLPFPVPSDPVFQARSELFEQPFEQYAVPQAILRFKQGFGRLIRSRTDRGVVAVLDRRLRSRRYGDSFMRSLPECTTRDLPARDLPAEVAAWLARGVAVPLA